MLTSNCCFVVVKVLVTLLSWPFQVLHHFVTPCGPPPAASPHLGLVGDAAPASG